MIQTLLSLACFILFSHLSMASGPTMVRHWTHSQASNLFKKCPAQKISVYTFNSCEESAARIQSQNYQICETKSGKLEVFSFFRCSEKAPARKEYKVSMIQTYSEANFAVRELRRLYKRSLAAKNILESDDIERAILEIRWRFPNHGEP